MAGEGRVVGGVPLRVMWVASWCIPAIQVSWDAVLGLSQGSSAAVRVSQMA